MLALLKKIIGQKIKISAVIDSSKSDAVTEPLPDGADVRLDHALLRFASLLELAGIIDIKRIYDKQNELVEECRKLGRPFIATMPVRSRFHCEICGIQAGEALVYVEDPTQPLNETASSAHWRPAAGLFVALEQSTLHNIFAHGEKPSEDFVKLLKGVK